MSGSRAGSTAGSTSVDATAVSGTGTSVAGTASTASTGGTLWLTTNNNTSRAAAIQAITQTTDNAHDLLFYTNSSFDTPKERLRIFAGGNVHIGPTPAADNGARLQVSGTATFSSSVTAGGNVLIPAGSGLAWVGDASRIMTPEDNVQGAKIATPGGFLAEASVFKFIGGNVLIGTTTSGASKLRIVGLPTSAAGLSSGDVYNLSGVLMIA